MSFIDYYSSKNLQRAITNFGPLGFGILVVTRKRCSSNMSGATVSLDQVNYSLPSNDLCRIEKLSSLQDNP